MRGGPAEEQGQVVLQAAGGDRHPRTGSITAAATTTVTSSPERAQITTMPLAFIMFGGSAALPIIGTGTLSQSLVAVPGIAIGQLASLAFAGGAWRVGPAGLPAALPSVLSLLAWSAVFSLLAARRFRWDQR